MTLFGRPQSPVPPHREVPPHPPADLSTQIPPALQPTGGQQVVLPGADFPPAGAIPVDVSGDADIAPGGSAFLLTIQVPQQVRFRMAGIGFGADDESSLRFLTWSILFNGDPAQSGYNSQPAAIGSLRQLADIFLIASSTVVVQIQAASASIASVSYRYICRMRGWFFTEAGGR